MTAIRKEIDEFHSAEEMKKSELVTLQKNSRTIHYDLGIKNNELTSLKIEVAKFETRKEDLEREIAAEASGIDRKKITSLNAPKVREQIEQLKRQLNIIGGIDQET